jgi:hypothetical protein
MTSSTGSDPNSHDDMGDVLSRVRQLDATSEEVAVRRYVREITEADALLETVDLGDAPLPVPFSSSWRQGPER